MVKKEDIPPVFDWWFLTMANVLDVGLLRDFSFVFGWVLIFVVIYGILQVTDIFKNRGIHALVALTVTVIVATTTGTMNILSDMTPWFVIIGFFVVFLIVISNFMGVPTAEVIDRFGGTSVVWWIFVPLALALIISLVSGGQFARGDTTQIDPETGEIIKVPGKTVINVITEPKVLGFILILGISAITVVLMAGVPKLAT